MENQQTEQQIQILRDELSAVKNKAFDMAAKSSDENSQLIAEIQRLQGLLGELCKMGQIENNDIQELANLIQSSVSNKDPVAVSAED